MDAFKKHHSMSGHNATDMMMSMMMLNQPSRTLTKEAVIMTPSIGAIRAQSQT